MKLPKILLITGFVFTAHAVTAQTASLVGSWQLVRQSTCLEETANIQQDDQETLRTEMKAKSGVASQVVSFKANSTGEESTRILNSRRMANAKKFHYKFNGDMLLILDKKSQTISDSYVVDKITSDSLILSSASRPCEVRIFAKISEERAN